MVPPEWQAAFLPTESLDRALNTPDIDSWSWEKPTFLTIDYAASRAAQLRKLLRIVAAAPPETPKLRILLLERDADPAHGWLASFRTESFSDRLEDLFDPFEPVKLRTLSAIDLRRAVFERTMERFAAFTGQKTPQPPVPAQDRSRREYTTRSPRQGGSGISGLRTAHWASVSITGIEARHT